MKLKQALGVGFLAAVAGGLMYSIVDKHGEVPGIMTGIRQATCTGGVGFNYLQPYTGIGNPLSPRSGCGELQTINNKNLQTVLDGNNPFTPSNEGMSIKGGTEIGAEIGQREVKFFPVVNYSCDGKTIIQPIDWYRGLTFDELQKFLKNLPKDSSVRIETNDDCGFTKIKPNT